MGSDHVFGLILIPKMILGRIRVCPSNCGPMCSYSFQKEHGVYFLKSVFQNGIVRDEIKHMPCPLYEMLLLEMLLLLVQFRYIPDWLFMVIVCR